MTQWPDVAVIMPVLNEENYLRAAVQAILDQNYPGAMSIALAVGPSKDRTQQVADELASRDSRIVVVANPTGRTPDGLNAAIAATTQEIVVRVDAHCELSEKYIETAIETLNRTGADNVGGVMAAVGQTPFEESVAAAMRSRLGVGAAAFHTGGSEGPADSVYLGVFRRSALKRVGGYDPHFTRAQDWEMNFRIRQTGGTVWFNPALDVTYRPRPTFRKLAKQYFEYGLWRREVMRTHPETTSVKSALRYFVPPLAVVGTLAGLALGACGFTWAYILPAGYLAIEAVASCSLFRSAKRGWFYVPMVLLTMHWSWGTGFIVSRSKR